MEEEFDKEKTKVLKYILYKKRTKNEILQKFSNENQEILEEIISYLEEAGYINEQEYIEKSIREFMNLKNLSLQEIQYKLLAKGLEKEKIEDYISEHKEELNEYEIKSAKKIIQKKQSIQEIEEITEYLRKKGYRKQMIQKAIEDEKKKGIIVKWNKYLI